MRKQSLVKMEKLLENRKGLAPLPGNILMFFILILIFLLVALVLFEDRGQYKYTPLTNLEVSAVDCNTLKIQHLGGDPLDFDPSETLVTLNVGSGDQRLEASGLKSLRVGDTAFLPLKSESEETINAVPESIATFKVTDLKSRRLIFVQKVHFGGVAGPLEEKPCLPGLTLEHQYVIGL